MNITLALPRHSVLNGTKDSEVPLLEAARAMNKDALVKIFDLYSPALYNYAYRLCNDSLMADYVVGDVFAKLLDQFSAGNGPSKNLRSYLYEAAYHLIVDEARHSYREAPLEAVDTSSSDGYAAYLSLENQLLMKTILLAIRTDLTKDQRHVIILRFLEGFSLIETAAIIGKQVNHVKVIQNRAIATLRRALADKVAE
jgi:RNA polymerase sigma-70 factor, ECF subfamily